MKEFLDVMLSAGLIVKNFRSDGKIHRVPTVTKPKKRNGWYTVFANEILIFGDWESGTKTVLSAGKHGYCPEKQHWISTVIEQQKVELAKKQREAEVLANHIFRKGVPVLAHPYLDKKGLPPYPNIVVSTGRLVIPMFDLSLARPKIVNLQLIDAYGNKRFLPGGKTKGLCYSYGLTDASTCTAVYICEGVATALTLHKNSQNVAVAAALTANNLETVTGRISRRFPSANLIIAGDDDWLTEQKTGRNPGKIAANRTANKYKAMVSFPPFTLPEKEEGLTDWNDYFMKAGGGINNG
ncbi:toprim domain-containing protein [Vibrio mediterranei]|uniref:toprim domain-containing protein n=1 Tax=Vibrio mediterranei TaxID=689 RepID=UPI004068D1C2